MKCFKIDLNDILKIMLLNKETLIPPRKHVTRYTNEYILYLVIGGELRLKLNGEEIVLKSGDIYLFDSGDYQEAVKASFCEYYFVHFETDKIIAYDMTEGEYREKTAKKRDKYLNANIYSTECYKNFYVYIKQKNHISDKALLQYYINLLKDNKVDALGKYPLRRLEISHSMQRFFLKLEETNGEKQKKSYYTARKIAQYIESNFREEISAKTIEEKFFINFDYANRIFERNIKCSIVKYRNLIRINHAKMMLSTTDIPVGIVAAEVGFYSAQYFCRFFKKLEGITPMEYRKRETEVCFDAKFRQSTFGN